MYGQCYLLITLVTFVTLSDAASNTSLRGAADTPNEQDQGPSMLTTAGNFVARHLLRASAASTGIIYQRNLEFQPVRAEKVNNMLLAGKDCMYSSIRMPLGDCFTNLLVDQNVLSDGFLPQTLMAGSPVIKGMLEFESKPRDEMTPLQQQQFLEEEKASEIIAKLGEFAESSENHGEFKHETMRYLKKKQDALELAPEALDSISIFMDVARFD